MSYRLLGYETVFGRKAALVEPTINEDLMKIWLDSEGSIVQDAVDGEPLSQMFAKMMFEATLTFIFSPFIFAEPYKVPEALVDTPPGMEVHVREQDLRRIGDLVVPVQVVEIRVFGEPYLKPGERATFVWVIGDFGDFLMLVQWEVLDVQAKEMLAMNMEVKRFVLR